MAHGSFPDLSGQLTFETDKGASRSQWIAVFLGLVLIGWMGSGYIFPTETEEDVAETPVARPVAVAVMPSQAQDIDLVLTAEGQSTPDRATGIKPRPQRLLSQRHKSSWKTLYCARPLRGG